MANKMIEFTTEYDLKAQIKAKKFSNVYVLFGDEHYMIKHYVKSIVSSAVTELPEFNVAQFDGNVKMQDVYDSAVAFPMMSPLRAVTLCDYPVDKATSAEAEKLFTCIKDIPQTSILILYFETVEINPKKPGDKFSKLFGVVEEMGGTVCNISRKTVAEITKMLQLGAAKRQCKLEQAAARYMVETCSDDLSTLINELEKLCAYVGDGGNITVNEINKVCSRSTEASVYNVSKAVLSGDMKQAYKILDDLLYMNTDPQYILMCLASAYVDIYRAYVIRSSGKRSDDVAKELGYYNTAFRLREAERSLSKLSDVQIVKSVKLLAECDKLMKSTRSDNRTLLEKVIVDLAIVARGRL